MPTTAYAITVKPPSVGGYAAPVAVRFEDAAAPGASPFANRPSLTLNGSLIGDSDETLISDVTTFYFVAATAVNLHAKVNGDDVDHRLGLVPLAYASPLAIALQPSSSGADLPDLASQYSPLNTASPAPPSLIEETVFDYYVDATSGSDANSGLTPLLAKQTLAGVLALTTSLAGKRIGLKRGDTYREAFNVDYAGTANAPTVIGAWGVGARPIIKATTVQATSGWSVSSGSIYVGTATGISTAAGLWVDEVYGLVRSATDQTGITAPGMYYSTSNTLYVWMPDSSNPTGHVFEKRSNAVSHCVLTVGHIRFEDISFRQATNPVCINTSGPSVVLRRCEVAYNMGTGIYCAGRTVIEDCDIHHNWNGKAYGASGAGNGVNFTGTGANGSIIRRCKLWENFVHVLANSSAPGILVLRNQMYRAHVNGIDHQGASLWAYHNFIHHRPIFGAGHGIDTQSGGTALTAKNNVVYCDVAAGGSYSPTNIQCMCINTGTGNSVDYNLLYLANTGITNVDIGKDTSSVVYPTLAAWTAATGFDAHSVSADPLVYALSSNDCRPTKLSPTLNVGVAIPGINDGYFGAAPDLGVYEMVA